MNNHRKTKYSQRDRDCVSFVDLCVVVSLLFDFLIIHPCIHILALFLYKCQTVEHFILTLSFQKDMTSPSSVAATGLSPSCLGSPEPLLTPALGPIERLHLYPVRLSRSEKVGSAMVTQRASQGQRK